MDFTLKVCSEMDIVLAFVQSVTLKKPCNKTLKVCFKVPGSKG